MNRSALNSSPLGSSGSSPYIAGVINAALVLIGALKASSLTKSSVNRASMAINAVGRGVKIVSGAASESMMLLVNSIGSKNHHEFLRITQGLELDATDIAWINHLRFIPVNQEMALNATGVGQDITTMEADRKFIVPASSRVFVIASSGSSARV